MQHIDAFFSDRDMFLSDREMLLDVGLRPRNLPRNLLIGLTTAVLLNRYYY